MLLFGVRASDIVVMQRATDGVTMTHPAVDLLVGVALICLLIQPANAQDPKALQIRGEYLVNGPAACGNCHTKRGADLFADASKYLTGGYKFDIPPGLAFSKNITPDNDTGIGSWTDKQIIRAIREGVTREGNLIGPPMPIGYYNKISDDDVNARMTSTLSRTNSAAISA
jgi:mono/diheme cytochrome c family protein